MVFGYARYGYWSNPVEHHKRDKMTSIAVAGLQGNKGKAMIGYLTALGLHALINLGAILLGLKLIPASVASVASYAAILVAFMIFQKKLQTAKRDTGTVSGEVIYFER